MRKPGLQAARSSEVTNPPAPLKHPCGTPLLHLRADMRFLHLADVHLDTSFRGRSPELRERLREAGRQVLMDAVEMALARGVDALLIAGDLFDGERLSFRSERYLMEALQRLIEGGVTPIYATGNHDPGGVSGTRSALQWPEELILFDAPEPRRAAVTRDGEVVGWVTGAGHDSPAVERDLSRDFPRPEGRLPEVALLHTQVMTSRGSEAHDRYAPSHLDHLVLAGFDYWALGHIHLPQELSAHPAVRYSGNPQGRHPGESGPRGALLVEVLPGSAPRIDFVELARIRWETLRGGDLSEAPSWRALVDRLAAGWQQARAGDPGRPGCEWIVRVELEGPSPIYRQLLAAENRREIAEELRDLLGVLDVEVRTGGLVPRIDPANHRDRIDVVGESLRLLDGILAGDHPDPAGLLGIDPGDLAALGDRGPAEYLQELLEGHSSRLLELVLRDGESS